jgi:hypothetical protein
MRYFVFVGGVLLTLLFVANAFLPAPPVAVSSNSAVDLSVIRIHSDRKWPERVVFDTSRPTITPAPAPAAATVAEVPSPQKTAAARPLKGGVREAYAQLRPNPSELRSPERKRKRKSVAKNYVVPPRFMVAQQPPVVFFGNNTW